MFACIQGSLHQGDLSFRNAGAQSTAIALYVLAFAFLSCNNVAESPSIWNSNTVNQLVRGGDAMYEQVSLQRRLPPFAYLLHEDLPQNIEIMGNQVNVAVYSDIFYGTVNQNINQETDFHSISFNEGLRNALELSDFVLSTFNDVTIAIFRSGDNLYIFDSHARDTNGYVDNDGFAVLLQFPSLQTLADFILHTYRNSVFNFSPVIFESNNDYLYTAYALHDHERNGNSLTSLQRSCEDITMKPIESYEHDETVFFRDRDN